MVTGSEKTCTLGTHIFLRINKPCTLGTHLFRIERKNLYSKGQSLLGSITTCILGTPLFMIKKPCTLGTHPFRIERKKTCTVKDNPLQDQEKPVH